MDDSTKDSEIQSKTLCFFMYQAMQESVIIVEILEDKWFAFS